MDDNIAFVESMFSGEDDYLVGRNIINQWFIEDAREDAAKNPRSGDHASDYKQPFRGAWRYCYRQSILQEFYMYEQEEMSVKRLRINKLGWYIHVMLQRLAKKHGHVVEAEKTHKHPRYGIYYTPDIIAKFYELTGDEDVAVEIKSMNKSSYEKATTEFFDDPMRGHADAYKQLQIYMFLHGLKKGMILIFCKDNSEFHYWLVDYSPEFMQPYIDRIETRLKLKIIFEAKDGQLPQHVLPKRVCESQDAKRAQSCPVGDLCWMKNAAARAPRLRTVAHGAQQNVSLIHEDAV
jgi:hypothetical protein